MSTVVCRTIASMSSAGFIRALHTPPLPNPNSARSGTAAFPGGRPLLFAGLVHSRDAVRLVRPGEGLRVSVHGGGRRISVERESGCRPELLAHHLQVSGAPR